MKLSMSLLLFMFLVTFDSETPAQVVWQSTNFPHQGTVQALAVNSGNHIFAATNDAGVFRSTDAGTSWVQTNNGLTALNVTSLTFDSAGALYAVTSGNGVYRSSDDATTWTHVNAGMANALVTSIVTKPGGLIFAGTTSGGVYRSTNAGSSWVQVNTRLNTFVNALAVNSQGTVFAGTNAAGVFLTTDNGTSWTQGGNPLRHSNVTALAILQNNVVIAGAMLAGTYRSTDNGETWVEGDTVMNRKFINSFVDNSLGSLFVATSSIPPEPNGVFQSTNTGQVWVEINGGLTSTNVFSLAAGADGFVYAGTSGGGVFRTVHSTTGAPETSHDLPSGFLLMQNYPNPFNPTTTIEFRMRDRGYAMLKVYGLLGADIASLVNEEMDAGVHGVTFDGRGLASGVYFYRLEIRGGNQQRGFSATKQLVLLK